MAPKIMTTTLVDLNLLYAAVDKAIEANDSHRAYCAWLDYVEYLRTYNRERGIPFITRLN